MNQATSYVSGQRSGNSESFATVLRELAAAMPIVVLFKAVRGVLKSSR